MICKLNFKCQIRSDHLIYSISYFNLQWTFLLSSYVSDEFKIRKKSIYKEVQWSLETRHLILNSVGKNTNYIITYSAAFSKVIYSFILKSHNVWQVTANKHYLENLKRWYTQKIRYREAWKKTSHKEAKPLRFASLLASWLSEKKMYLSSWTKQKLHSFHEHKRERMKERKRKYTDWFTNHKSWDYKGLRGASNQHAKQRKWIPQSDPLSCLCCAQLHWFWGKPMKFQNSFQYFFMLPFFHYIWY